MYGTMMTCFNAEGNISLEVMVFRSDQQTFERWMLSRDIHYFAIKYHRVLLNVWLIGLDIAPTKNKLSINVDYLFTC